MNEIDVSKWKRQTRIDASINEYKFFFVFFLVKDR